MLSTELIELCRWFAFLDQNLLQGGNARWLTLAAYTYKHYAHANRSPSDAWLKAAEAAFIDHRLGTLHPRRKGLLLAATGAAFAQWLFDPERARSLLRSALELTLHIHTAAGPPTLYMPRRTIQSMIEGPGDLYGSDPSGDPEPEPHHLPMALEVPRAYHLQACLAPATIQQVLDGITTWETIVQDLWDVPLGLMRTSGIPAILSIPADGSSLPTIVRLALAA